MVPTLAAAAKMTVGKTVPAFRASLLLRGLGGRDDRLCVVQFSLDFFSQMLFSVRRIFNGQFMISVTIFWGQLKRAKS